MTSEIDELRSFFDAQMFKMILDQIDILASRISEIEKTLLEKEPIGGN